MRQASSVDEQPAAISEGFRFEGVSVIAEDGTVILDAISAEIPARGITVIAGPSGAGKSTLLRLCNRLDAPSGGRVLLGGTDIASLDPLLLRRRVGMVFQHAVVFAGTVRDNLVVADADGTDERFSVVLERAGLDAALLDRQADDLSGGEAQRMCLARTLLTEPEFLLMDEPTSALDPDATMVIERLARTLADAGTPMVWVTHDLAQRARLADSTIVLLRGRLADDAETAAFLAARDPEGA